MLGQIAKSIFNGVSLHYGTGSQDVFRRSTRLAFGSSVEVVDGQGKLVDIAYAGKEETFTEVKKGAPTGSVGDGDMTSGVTLKIRHLMTNEDIEKTEIEKTKFLAN